jgi:hypothetical protein
MPPGPSSEYANSVAGRTLVAQSGRTRAAHNDTVAQSSAFLDLTRKPAAGQVFLDAILPSALPVLPNWVDIEDR